jgi:hypothetical protein
MKFEVYTAGCLLGHYAVWTCRWLSTFRRSLQVPSSVFSFHCEDGGDMFVQDVVTNIHDVITRNTKVRRQCFNWIRNDYELLKKESTLGL